MDLDVYAVPHKDLTHQKMVELLTQGWVYQPSDVSFWARVRQPAPPPAPDPDPALPTHAEPLSAPTPAPAPAATSAASPAADGTPQVTNVTPIYPFGALVNDLPMPQE